MTYRLAPIAQLRRAVFPKAPALCLEALVSAEEDMREAGILTTKTRAALFLAHVAVESGGLTFVRENLTYSTPERLQKVWPGRFPTRESALPYVRAPEKLAAKVYDGRADLGNKYPGDGWLCRGAGWLQATGRAAFEEVGEIIGIDLIAKPWTVADPNVSMAIAIGVWRWKKLNQTCDGQRPIENSTRRLNGGLTGLEERKRVYIAAQGVVLG